MEILALKIEIKFSLHNTKNMQIMNLGRLQKANIISTVNLH